MTFLPLVERELLVRSRQSLMFWVRTVVVALGLLLCVQQLEFAKASGGSGQGGQLAFRSLILLGFVLCSFGCLATADAVSWERREKTLGLLFLTRVRGVDILLGKLVSGSLVILCALVAFLPVLMIPVLAGGVSGREAFRMGLMLINTAILSLTAGLLASTWHSHWFKAARAAFALVAGLLFLPLIGQLFCSPVPAIGLLSPLYGASFADDPGPAFWISLGLGQLTIWLLFVRACRALRASRVDEPVEQGGEAGGQTNPRPTVRQSSLYAGLRPIEWLLRRQRGIGALVWAGAIFTVIFGALRMYLPILAGAIGSSWLFSWPIYFLGTVVTGGLFAWAASRFFFEARRSGELELLLTTPIGAETIVREHWLFLRRILHWPLIIILLQLGLQYSIFWFRNQSFGGPGWFTIYYLSNLLIAIVTTIFGLVALCWVAIWSGLKSGTQAAAVIQTLVWVKLPPFLWGYAWSIVMNLFRGSFGTSGPMTTYILLSLLPQVVTVIFYVWLIRRMRHRSLSEMRDAHALPKRLFGGQENWINRLRRARHWTPA